MSNNVDHPAHYQADGYEAIDIIAAFTKELHGVEAFDVGNAIKYLLRWDKKNVRISTKRYGIWCI